MSVLPSGDDFLDGFIQMPENVESFGSGTGMGARWCRIAKILVLNLIFFGLLA